MISIEPSIISFLRAHYPGIKAGVGVGVTDLTDGDTVTVSAVPFPIGDKMLGAVWVTDIQVFSTDRSKAFRNAYDFMYKIREAVNSGQIGDAVSCTPETLPRLIPHNYSSQAHKAVSFALRITGHYG